MKLSILIPVYNEVQTLPLVVDRLLTMDLGMDVELVVSDDGSTDGTADLVAGLADRPQIKVVLGETNRGKGAALRAGLPQVTGELVLIQDADLEYDPDDIPQLLAPILAGRADVVLGSRFVGGESHRVLYFWHSLANRWLTFLSNMLSDLNLTDMEVGYKVFRQPLLTSIDLHEDRFGFEPEVVARLTRVRVDGKRVRFYEVGISYNGRTYEEGKKIGWKDGAWALWCILRYNLAAPRVKIEALAPLDDKA